MTNLTIDALDEMNRARSLIELAKMACRSDDEELEAIASGLAVAGDHLERATAKLQSAT
ncbi:hypothetical protein [uncultured Roseobacter sp.]|uniref:hypothetical protein n=1 Tax=uncultured Roseobacter sp. TaxID=114847 RepID=UPI0026329F36|nr:hypothetical protein [uncultured Roseobacter sp.]